jgi:outer membrane lipoprotein-sorting protein
MDGQKLLRISCLGIALLAISTTAQSQDAEHKLAPAIRIAKQSMKVAEGLKDYSANFFKRERVGGQTIVHSMAVKMRHEPFSVYLRFHKPHDGREVIFVKGQNNGNLLAHETGIKSVVGTVSLSPNSKEALSESKHPITEMGMANLVKHLIEQWEFESKYGESEVKYYPNAKLGDRQVKVVESSHPVPRKQFPYHKTMLYIDKETGLPIRIEHYAFPVNGQPAQRVEEFTYSNVQTNIGLTDTDFSTQNPNYGY